MSFGEEGPVEPMSIDLHTEGAVTLSGAVRAPTWLSVATLRAMPQQEMTVSFECRTSGLRRHHFSGARHISQIAAIRLCADDRLWG